MELSHLLLTTVLKDYQQQGWRDGSMYKALAHIRTCPILRTHRKWNTGPNALQGLRRGDECKDKESLGACRILSSLAYMEVVQTRAGWDKRHPVSNVVEDEDTYQRLPLTFIYHTGMYPGIYREMKTSVFYQHLIFYLKRNSSQRLEKSFVISLETTWIKSEIICIIPKCISFPSHYAMLTRKQFKRKAKSKIGKVIRDSCAMGSTNIYISLKNKQTNKKPTNIMT